MPIVETSNTLVSIGADDTIAYGEQLKDRQIDWTDNSEKYNGSYPNPNYDPEDPTKGPERIPYIPASFKTEDSKFQSKLNEFFLNHWADWQKFLNDEGVDPQTIDSWKEVEDFLKGIDDSEALTLLGLIEDSELVRGTMNIEMSNDVPGMMVATTNVLVPNIGESYIDEETGIIKMVYNFE